MKSLTAAAIAKFSDAEDVRPVMLVEVDWPIFGRIRYADREISISGSTVPLQSRILSLSPINMRTGASQDSSVSSVTVTLSDYDLSLQARMRASALVDGTVKVILAEESLGEADIVTLFEGRPSQPTWNEDQRTLEFEIVSSIKSETVGHVPTEDEIGQLPEDFSDQSFPLVFGKVVDVPGVRVKVGPETFLPRDIDSSDTNIVVENGEDEFGSGTITIKIDGELIKGHFDDDVFKVDGRNKNKYGAQKTGARSGVDADNWFVLWLDDADLDVVGYYFVTDQVPGFGTAAVKRRVNFCIAQKGKKCWFEKPWSRNDENFWLVPADVSFDVVRFAAQWVDLSGGAGIPGAFDWVHKAGTTVTEYGNEDETWVVNEIVSDDVLDVKCFRSWQRNVVGQEERRLVTVPANYYTVNLSNSTLVPGMTVTTIKFNVRLSQLNQGWDDSQIFATVASSVGSNPATIIDYILTNYSSVNTDFTSFALAQAASSQYPAHCVVQNGPDAIQVCHDIAYQARLALTIIGNTARLRYISTVPLSADIAVGASTRERSAVVEEESSENITTVLKATWMRKLSEPFKDERPKKVVVKVNVDKYGTEEEERDWWIYRNKSLVAKSVQFRANRSGYVWKTVRVSGSLALLAAEPWDTAFVSLGSDVFTPDPVIGWILDVQISSAPYGVALKVWVPVIAGTQTAISGSPAYLSDAGDSAPTNPASKVKEGTTEIARVSPISFNLVSEPLLDTVNCIIVKVIKHAGSKYDDIETTIELYPNGYTSPPSGTAFCRFVNTAGGATSGTLSNVRTVVTRSPGGGYIGEI